MMLRRLLTLLVLLVVLALGADIGSRLLAQNVVAEHLERSLALSERPSVSLHGFPFLLGLARGRIPSAAASADTVQAEGIGLESVRLTLDELRFSPAELVARRRFTIRATSGHGTAVMTAEDISTALQKVQPGLSVHIDQEVVTVSAGRPGSSVRARVTLSGRTLSLRSIDPKLRVTVSIELPEFFPGVSFTGLRLSGDRAVLCFRLDHPSFVVSAQD